MCLFHNSSFSYFTLYPGPESDDNLSAVSRRLIRTDDTTLPIAPMTYTLGRPLTQACIPSDSFEFFSRLFQEIFGRIFDMCVRWFLSQQFVCSLPTHLHWGTLGLSKGNLSAFYGLPCFEYKFQIYLVHRMCHFVLTQTTLYAYAKK